MDDIFSARLPEKESQRAVLVTLYSYGDDEYLLDKKLNQNFVLIFVSNRQVVNLRTSHHLPGEGA